MYKKTVLDGGLRLVTSSNPNTLSVCIGIFLAAGPKYEKPDEAGISHFLEHLCFKGTARWPTSRDVSEAIEGVGGIFNGGTDKEVTIYWCKVAKPHFRLALDVLTDLVRRPKLDPGDLEKERPVIIEEINMCWDSPQMRVDALGDELMWPGQYLGRDIAGSRESVTGLTHQMVSDYLLQRYLPNGTVLSIAGNIDQALVEESVREAFSGWAAGESPPGAATDDTQDAPRLSVEHRPTEQANLCLAMRGVSAVHPDRFKLDLLNAILGEGMSSRLFSEIRERRGLAYDIHSYTSHFIDSGSWNICAGVEPKRLEEAVIAILEELSRFREDISEADAAKAKEMTKGRLLLRMEDSRNVAAWLGSQEIVTGRILTVDDVVSVLDGITVSDLRAVAQDLLKTEGLNLAVVGPLQEKDALASALKL